MGTGLKVIPVTVPEGLENMHKKVAHRTVVCQTECNHVCQTLETFTLKSGE